MGEKMAAPRGGTIESIGSAQCVRSTMETGEVDVTSDATTIKGEITKGITEKLRDTRGIRNNNGDAEI